MPVGGFADLEQLGRDELLALAYDYMLTGMIEGRATTPLLAMSGKVPDVDTLSIDKWMGASPVYTGRMRRLMGVEGDRIADIMKVLQLDVGFVHGYMDVAYRIDDSEHGEFWLLHCGALLDVEPMGEDRVFNMCHTIEDPTFDATALATNPRSRIRPIHRPPRTPADRHPHCHWTIVIDEANEPIGPIAHTQKVSALPLAALANAIGDDRGGGHLHDYRGEFEPGFRLTDLSNGALAAVAREFQLQAHLLCASTHLAVAGRASDEVARGAMDESWRIFGWLIGQRQAGRIDRGAGAQAVARALALSPAIPPGFDREVSCNGDRITLTLEGAHPGMFDAGHPGWSGSLSRGATNGIEGVVGGLGFEAKDVKVSIDEDRVGYELTLAPAAANRALPDLVKFGSMGKAANWNFQPILESQN